MDSDVDAFLAGLPPQRKEMVVAIDTLVRSATPNLAPKMWGDMLGYGSYHYRYASGREGDWSPVAVANNKQYVSVYLCATVDGRYLAESNAHRLGKVSVGKSCIRFKKLEDINLDVLADLIRQTEKAMEDDSFAM